MNKYYILLIVVMCFAKELRASTVKASSFGLRPKDQTVCLQKALSSRYDTVIIDDIGRTWFTGPLNITRNNLTVIFAREIKLSALPGAYPNKLHSVFTISRAKNIRFVGNNASVFMNPNEYNDGDWRMGFRILDAEGVSIDNLQIHHCAGDGIYISRFHDKFSKDITITNCRIFGNKRHSISIVSAKNVLVKNCQLYGNTGKNGYSCGIDIEPNKPDEYITNIIFDRCIIYGNQLTGITTCFQLMDATSPPVSVTFRNCRIDDNFIGVRLINSKEDGPAGIVKLENSVINNNRSYGLIVASTPKIMTEVAQCTFSGNSYANKNECAILLDGTYNNQKALIKKSFGGVVFNKSQVIDKLNRPFIKYRHGNGRIEGVRGNLEYSGPYPVRELQHTLSEGNQLIKFTHVQ